MGIANSVPGVSGGTIAFILGFYDTLINSLHDIASNDKTTRKKALIYIIKIGIGLAASLLLCILILTKLFETNVYELCSAFIGLTLAAIPFVVIQEKETIKGKYYRAIWAVLGAEIVVLLSLLRIWGFSIGNINFSAGLSVWQYFYLFFVGLIAISAMILPGISGSTILLIFGVYMPVLDAVKQFLKLDWSFALIAGLAVFCLGILAGIVISIKCIKVALNKFRSQMVWLILGLMAGSVFAIMQGPTTLDVPKNALTVTLGKPDSIRIIALIIGAAILVGLEFLKKYTEKKNAGN